MSYCSEWRDRRSEANGWPKRETRGRLRIQERLPLAEVVVEDRVCYRVGCAEIFVLGRSVNELAILVAGERMGQPKDVVCSFGSLGQKNDAERRPIAGAAVVFPDPQDPVLIRFVAENFGADGLFAAGIEGFGRVVDFKEQIEIHACELKLKMAIGLLAVLPCFQSQSAIAGIPGDLDVCKLA